MKYFFKSVFTISFWRHALFSPEAITKMLATIGAILSLVEVLDLCKIYTKDHYSKFAIIPIALFSLFYVVITRRPISKISYKPSVKDYKIEVRIGDLFDGDADVIVSTNTTFDTDMASGLIATNSVQGQVATRFFQANTLEIDKQLDAELATVASTPRPNGPGKKLEYPIGTVASVKSYGRTFFFVAMSRLSDTGTASSNKRDVSEALECLWDYVAKNGNLRPISIPLMGTGRGRLTIPRKKIAETIAQSFADASTDQIFCNQLSIVVRPDDAENYSVNLYQIRDYLVQSLHA